MGGLGSGRPIRREPEKVEQILRLYAEGKLLKDIVTETNTGVKKIVSILKEAGVYDPDRSRSAYMTALQKANDKRHENAGEGGEDKARQKIKSRGFSYIGGYCRDSFRVYVRCDKCGAEGERSLEGFRKGTAICFNCRRIESEKRKAENRKLREIKNQKRERERELQKAEREKEKNRKFDEVHVCRICGQPYTPRQYMESCGLKYFSNAGYCSATCRYNELRRKSNECKKKSGRKNDKHYRRAIKLGLPAERGITLKKLIERDGLFCRVCGVICIYGGDPKSDLYPSIDHIVPINKGGGHTWDNVQVAHRICNSVKSDRIGVKYGNVKN